MITKVRELRCNHIMDEIKPQHQQKTIAKSRKQFTIVNYIRNFLLLDNDY